MQTKRIVDLWRIWALAATLVFAVLTLAVSLQRTRYVVVLQVAAPPRPLACPSGHALNVLQLLTPDSISLNGRFVPRSQVPAAIEATFAYNPQKLLFIVPAPQVSYQDFITLVSEARSSGAKVIALGEPATCDPGTPWSLVL